MPAISRARTGCWTCRSRRIKCDETHPVCRRCSRNNSPCGYGIRLIWHEESIARGVCHGRAGVWSKKNDVEKDDDRMSPRASTPTKGCKREQIKRRNLNWMFLNTTTSDIQAYYHGPESEKWRQHKIFSASAPARWLNSIPAQSKRTQYDPTLMTFFEHTICSSLTLVDNASYNPYRYLILPMALESEGLYHAALAVAAITLRLSNPHYQLPALEHHNHALAFLRMLLTRERWDDKELDEMLGLVLMLCWFDISDNSRSSWVTHLSGFQDLINTRKKRPGYSSHSKELASFFNRYFMFHLVLARTAFRVNDATSNEYLLPHETSESPDIIDPYMGFSHSLLCLVSKTTELAWTESESYNPNTTDVIQLRDDLENLQQQVPAELIDPGTECMAIAEANRLGALLLLHEICSPKPGPRGHKLPVFDTEEKVIYVDRILNLIMSKKVNMMRTAVLPLWPLFLAGCCSSTEEQRLLVLQLFEELDNIRRFGNIAPAMEVVQMVWRQNDLAVQDERKRKQLLPTNDETESSYEARFAWEHAMSILGGWKLSLT